MAERKQLTCNSFVFYGSFYEAISVLPAENQAHIYDAIFKFAFENIEVELDGVELAVFLLIKPQLIANRARYENGCKGGAPRGNQNARKKTINDCSEETTENNQETTMVDFENNQKQPNDNDNVNENYISLLKILKNKESIAGVYARGFKTELCDEILNSLVYGCELTEPINLSGVYRNAEDFKRVAKFFDGEALCEIVNAIIPKQSEIKDMRFYIFGVIANRFMK